MPITKQAREYIAKKISKNIKEGKSVSQATAIAYSQARKKGYKVPRKR